MTSNTSQATIIAEHAVPARAESSFNFPSLTCQILPSQLTCLLGPHRTQLRAYLLMLAGISKPEQGKVEIIGQDVSKLDALAWRELRYQVGYLSGSSPLLSTEHGLMNVMLPLLYHHHLSFRETADKARSLLLEMNGDYDPTTYPALLTGFQRSQLALARALIVDPQVLILDLPFNDLGAKEREKMGELLVKYKQNRAVCMIGGLQYPHFLEQHAEQIIFISENKVMSFNSWRSFLQAEDADVQKLLSVL